MAMGPRLAFVALLAACGSSTAGGDDEIRCCNYTLLSGCFCSSEPVGDGFCGSNSVPAASCGLDDVSPNGACCVITNQCICESGTTSDPLSCMPNGERSVTTCGSTGGDAASGSGT